jgi:hypothetical protein
VIELGEQATLTDVIAEDTGGGSPLPPPHAAMKSTPQRKSADKTLHVIRTSDVG